MALKNLSRCTVALALLMLALPSLAQNITVNVTQDLIVLNYALFLEQLESEFYQLGLATFPQATFDDEGYTGSVRSYVNLIYQHEQAHVSVLNETIYALGGLPRPRCIYNFTTAFINVTTFLETAAQLESVGTSAYDGAINKLTEPNLIQAAATIATVEARHASFLRGIFGEVPFPNTFDPAFPPANVSQLVNATDFVISCPTKLILPN